MQELSVSEGLAKAMALPGVKGVMLADYNSGMVLGKEGGGLDLDIAAAGNTQVVRAKLVTMQELNLDDEIEEILICLRREYHVLIPIPDKQLFFYVVLNRDKNLASARYGARDIFKQVNTDWTAL